MRKEWSQRYKERADKNAIGEKNGLVVIPKNIFKVVKCHK